MKVDKLARDRYSATSSMPHPYHHLFIKYKQVGNLDLLLVCVCVFSVDNAESIGE